MSLVLTGDLARAVRKEAVPAIKHWWGVGTSAVWKWRRALGVEDTEGNRLIRVEHQTPERVAAFVKAIAPSARSPVRRAKIAAAKRGKPRPAHVVEILRQANVGKRHTEASRAKMSASQKARAALGNLPPAAGVPWSA
ncbi:hypothetical protein [Anatilimnocola aggregata]